MADGRYYSHSLLTTFQIEDAYAGIYGHDLLVTYTPVNRAAIYAHDILTTYKPDGKAFFYSFSILVTYKAGTSAENLVSQSLRDRTELVGHFSKGYSRFIE